REPCDRGRDREAEPDRRAPRSQRAPRAARVRSDVARPSAGRVSTRGEKGARGSPPATPRCGDWTARGEQITQPGGAGARWAPRLDRKRARDLIGENHGTG